MEFEGVTSEMAMGLVVLEGEMEAFGCWDAFGAGGAVGASGVEAPKFAVFDKEATGLVFEAALFVGF